MTEIRSGVRDGFIWTDLSEAWQDATDSPYSVTPGRLEVRIVWAEFDLPGSTTGETWLQQVFGTIGQPAEVDDALIALAVEAARRRLDELSPPMPH